MKKISEINNIAEAWIFLQNSDYESIEYKSKEWSAQKLNMMCINECDVAWEVVKKIFELSPDPWVLENLGAGPVETLFSMHGDISLKVVRDYSISNPNFSKVVEHVWGHALPPIVAGKLNK
jgi:hypothetical protein